MIKFRGRAAFLHLVELVLYAAGKQWRIVEVEFNCSKMRKR